MAARFSAEQVTAIARLAQLELEPAEVTLFARQLGDFLGYATRCWRSTPPASLRPPTSSRATNRTGPIRSHASLDREAALANAPDASLEAGLFKVPRVIG